MQHIRRVTNFRSDCLAVRKLTVRLTWCMAFKRQNVMKRIIHNTICIHDAQKRALTLHLSFPLNNYLHAQATKRGRPTLVVSPPSPPPSPLPPPPPSLEPLSASESNLLQSSVPGFNLRICAHWGRLGYYLYILTYAFKIWRWCLSILVTCRTAILIKPKLQLRLLHEFGRWRINTVVQEVI